MGLGAGVELLRDTGAGISGPVRRDEPPVYGDQPSAYEDEGSAGATV